MIKNHITQMLQGCRLLSDGGHDDFNQGQISCRLPDGKFLIKSAMVGFASCSAEDFCICHVDPKAVLPKDAPPETSLHQAIYASRPDVNCIVHSHPESSIVFGATNYELKPISHEGSYFHNNIGRFDESTNTILSISLGEAVADALGEMNALFLCNHGIVIASKTIRLSVILALMLERACRIQLRAEALGTQYRTTSDKEVDEKKDYIYSDMAIRSYWKSAVRAIREP